MTNSASDAPALESSTAFQSNFSHIHLSRREQQVAACIVAGLSDKNISLMLAISIHTVQGYNKSLYTKFGIHKRTELAQALTSVAS